MTNKEQYVLNTIIKCKDKINEYMEMNNSLQNVINDCEKQLEREKIKTEKTIKYFKTQIGTNNYNINRLKANIDVLQDFVKKEKIKSTHENRF